MISNLVPKWYQIWRRLDKLLPRMANTSLQDGPHYDFFWLTLLPPKRVHARTGLKTFVLRYTVDPKTDHLSARQTLRNNLGETCLQNGLHFSSKWPALTIPGGRPFASRRVACPPPGGPPGPFSAADRLSTTSAKARPARSWSRLVSRATQRPKSPLEAPPPTGTTTSANRCQARVHSGDDPPPPVPARCLILTSNICFFGRWNLVGTN